MFIKKKYLLISLIIAAFFFDVKLYAAEDRATSVIETVLEKLAPGKWRGKYDFVNYRTDGSKHEYTLEIQAINNKTVHVTFLSPLREKGRQILNKDGEIWSYLPDSRKVVRLAGRDSIGNGDFNNADVLKLNWLDDYTAKLVKESDKQFVVDLTAKKNSSADYHLIRIWILKKTMQPVQQYFYDNIGHHLKTLKYRDVKNFHGIERPSLMVMENVITKQKTLLKILDFNKANRMPESRFQPSNLGK
ncbi:MAG: outer membrane lipoprotein-sorting protein [Spirochaetia bacterium]|nr:outer membrane lipoprotein-sorting protein [Spirochaetia bacterium]